jgi:hypothetical protein
MQVRVENQRAAGGFLFAFGWIRCRLLLLLAGGEFAGNCEGSRKGQDTLLEKLPAPVVGMGMWMYMAHETPPCSQLNCAGTS